MRVVLGVTGCIAAYKATEIVRRLREKGADVTVVATEASLNFVGESTWEALSGNTVYAGVFEDVPGVAHVRLGSTADLVVVAPATADFLARAAAGRADDMLTSVLLTTHAPVLLAPGMHTQMWEHPATQANVETLRSRGVIVKEPASGRLTGKDSGVGRFPDPHEIVEIAATLLDRPAIAADAAVQDFSASRVLVSAGGTQEPIDPVRFIGNRSSGKMGYALARVASLRGAQTTLVAANTSLAEPSAVTVESVTTTADMAENMNRLSAGHDIVIMAAAPADFTAADASDKKIKKSSDKGLTLHLEQTTDVLAGLSARRLEGQIIVGFAAETASDKDELLSLGMAKLERKGADLLVLNNVSGGDVFGKDSNDVIIINSKGVLAEAKGEKMSVAWAIMDAIKKHAEDF